MDTTVGATGAREDPALTAGRSPAAGLATTLGAVVLVLSLGAVVLQWVSGDLGGFLSGFRLYELIAVPSFGTAGMVVAGRKPRNAVGWIMLTIALSHACAVAGASYAEVGVTTVSTLPGAGWALWVSTWVWVPGLWLVPTLLLLVFPDGRVLSRWWRGLAVVGVVGTAVSTVMWALVPYDQQQPPLDVQFEHPFAANFVSELMGLDLVVAGIVSIGALASLAVRFRQSDELERQQIKWVAAAGALVFVLLAVAIGQPDGAGPYVVAVAMVPLPAAIAVAVVRHGLWDIDLVINRSLVYGMLTLAILVVYVVTVAGLGGLLGATTGAPLVATGLVALGIQPARERLQRLANRLLYGERDDPYRALSELARRLDAIGSEGQTIADVAEAIARALRVPYVAVESDGEVLAVHGRAVEEPMRLPLTAKGTAVGQLLITGRGPGAELSASEQRLLSDLARQVGAAVHGHRLTQDLQRSRERLVNAREEERRRLRRDLHDDVGPALAAAALQLDRARDLVTEAADDLLGDVARRLRAVVVDVRTLVEDLRPRALDDLGLVAALRRRAAHFSAADLDVSLDISDDLGTLPAAVDVAAYRIVSEALSNVARHARARHVCLTVHRSRDNHLEISVTDDGDGLRDGAPIGVGLSSMRERAEELGGSFLVRSQPTAGTTVEACLPVAVP